MILRNKFPLGIKLCLVAGVYAFFGFIYYRGHQLHKSRMFENEDLLFASPLMLVLLFVANYVVLWMHEYQRGYRSVLAAVDIGCHMGVKGETFLAYQDGWTAGIKAGRKDHPEKLVEMLGVPLECILQLPEYKSQHPSPAKTPLEPASTRTNTSRTLSGTTESLPSTDSSLP